MAQRRFVILDRDGTVIVERNYLSDVDQVALLPGAAEGLRRMSVLGLGLVVITNQSGVGRGYFSDECVARVHRRMAELLAAEGVRLDGVYYCPHLPEDDCTCRKPKPGLLLKAAAELQFEPRDCLVVGDKVCDLELGRNVGATTFLVQTGYGARLGESQRSLASYNVAGLPAAADVMARLVKSP
ncbi:MAG: HAD family hydrolase [Planctomycetota bacterium]|nr:HAD family hydrolase [Planctomycetota bacterium]